MTDWAAILKRVAPGANPRIAAMVIEHADHEFERRNIRSMRRQASILAHMAHETAGFTVLEENLNYTAQRAHQVWPNRFRSPSEAQMRGVAHNSKALALAVYNGRMGNRKGTDDGWIFRGKGLLQCTGRDNVARLARELGITPELAADWLISPKHALACACVIYNMLNIGPAADAGDMKLQTRRINGGLNGLADRQAAYNRAMRALATQTAPTVVGRARQSEPDGDAALDMVSVADLRESGSRTIAGADEVKQAFTGVAAASATISGVATQAKDVADQAQEAITAVKSGVSFMEVVKDYWIAIVFFLALIVLGIFIIRGLRGANKVIDARVDDARTGANVGR